MGLFSVGLGLNFMAYLGFDDGSFGLHYLRFNLGIFMAGLVLLYVYGCVYFVPNYGWFGACLILF